MARCRVRVLGGFEVSCEGRQVTAQAWQTRRAADVVKLLALEPGHTLHRERLMAALWPELGEEAAGANLRKAVHHARRALGGAQAISGEGPMLSLFGGDVNVDSDEFLAQLREAQRSPSIEAFAGAADLYTGDVLPADRYEAWVAEPRERFHERYLEALKGAHLWQRVLEVDPTDEQSHRSLMRQHHEAGRRREALRQFEVMRDALREYIGVGPDRETVALYEQVLAMDGGEPPSAAHRAAQLIATGLVALNQGEIDEAARCARDARDIAVAAQLGHEVGDASTLLALAGLWSGRWQQVFEQDFAASLEQGPAIAREMVDAHLCFVEYSVSGVSGFAAGEYARHLLSLSARASSPAGRGIAQLMLGEALLLAGELGAAATELERACAVNRENGLLCGFALSLEHLAEVHIARGDRSRARRLVAEAYEVAQQSSMPSHLTVRALGVRIRAAPGRQNVREVLEAEHVLAEANRVCDPCSINFHVQAAAACAGAGDRARARSHLASAERIAGLWSGGPWAAAVWEARAAVRLADGEPAQANALLREAADAFTGAQRPLDAARCRAAAAAVA